MSQSRFSSKTLFFSWIFAQSDCNGIYGARLMVCISGTVLLGISDLVADVICNTSRTMKVPIPILQSRFSSHNSAARETCRQQLLRNGME